MGGLQEHLEKLPALLAIEGCGSLRQAAQSLRITQPALTRQIQILEQAVDQKLLHRNAHGVVLTQQGKTIAECARKILSAVSETEASLAIFSDRHQIRLGTFDSLAIRIFPEIISKLREHCKETQISVTTGDSSDLYKQLQEGHIDCALVSIDSRVPGSLRVSKLATDAYGFFASPKVAKQAEESGTAQMPLITVVSPDCAVGYSLLKKIEGEGIRFGEVIAVDTFEAAANYARRGIGIALLPYLLASPSLKKSKLSGVDLIPKNKFEEHSVALVYDPQSGKRSTLIKLAEFLKKYFSET